MTDALHVYDQAGEVVPVTEEQIKPNPMIWPVCDTCGTSYILRRALSFTTGQHMWVWQKDCEKPRSTCKNSKPVVHDAKGECPPTGRTP